MLNKKVWIEGEVQAQKYLAKLGYKILGTNMKIAGVEIDIVAICPQRVLLRDLKQEYKQNLLIKSSYEATKKQLMDTLVFVEVKARSTNEYGMPYEAVDRNKQYRIRRAGDTFTINEKYSEMPIRYDIISILDGELEHIKNAF